MALDNYANLQTSVINFSHRTDLNALIPDFIRLAEDKIYAVLESTLQDAKVTLVTVANQEAVTLPTDFMDMRSVAITLNNNAGTLDYLSPDQLQNQYPTQQTGMSRVYSIVNTAMILRPIPDAIYNLELIYTAKFTKLSTASQTNWILTNYPSLYLYATLEQVAMYTADDARGYEAEWQRIAAGINIKDWHDSSTMQVKTDVNLSR